MTSFRRYFALMLSYIGVDIDDFVSILIRLCSQLTTSISSISYRNRFAYEHNVIKHFRNLYKAYLKFVVLVFQINTVCRYHHSVYVIVEIDIVVSLEFYNVDIDIVILFTILSISTRKFVFDMYSVTKRGKRYNGV